jgi:non-specific serine/threonine protein kinase
METNLPNFERQALAPGTRLGQYEVRELAGATSADLIYEGFDLESGRPLLIHEFFPARVTRRLQDSTIRELNPGLEENFVSNKLMYLDTGSNLARVKYSALAEILSTWEENNTVYRACPIYRSITLEEYLVKNPTPTPTQVKGFIGPLLGAIETIHEAKLLHLAISSTTLHIVQESNVPLLFGLGEVRYENSDVTQKQTTVLEQAYSPIELSSGLDIKFQPSTDIYGLAAIFYRLIARQAPIPATARLVTDNLERLIDLNPIGYDEHFLRAIDRALSLKPEDRPQTVAQFRSELLSPRKNNAQLLRELSPEPVAPEPVAPRPIKQSVDTASLISSAQERLAKRESNQDLKALLGKDKNASPVIRGHSADKHLPSPAVMHQDLTPEKEQSKRPFLRSLMGIGLLTSVGGAAYYLLNQRSKDVLVQAPPKVVAKTQDAPKAENLINPPQNAVGAEIKGLETPRIQETPKPVDTTASKPNLEPRATTPPLTTQSATQPLSVQPRLEANAVAKPTIAAKQATVEPTDVAKPIRKPKSGRVNLRITPWGEVYVNGNFRGNSPPIKSISLPPGKFTIEVRNPGGPTQRIKVQVASGKQTTLMMQFPKLK